MANSPMHHDPHATASGPERLELGESAWPLYWTSTIVGVANNSEAHTFGVPLKQTDSQFRLELANPHCDI